MINEGKITVEYAVDNNPFAEFIDLGRPVGQPFEYPNGIMVEWSKGIFTDIQHEIKYWNKENVIAQIQMLQETMNFKRRFLCIEKVA